MKASSYQHGPTGIPATVGRGLHAHTGTGVATMKTGNLFSSWNLKTRDGCNHVPHNEPYSWRTGQNHQVGAGPAGAATEATYPMAAPGAVKPAVLQDSVISW